ncbi:ankyrin repeat domain protein [Fusarium beomiforme]|uniref:Ankyrin repeat domain protein n=1 Tax=Fusarium beomiforme TaxID=44412 RepID=A0A9P5AV89_9HYPO|nr:ankyrin repeat domain protein [Fusarium beomiforme]
MGSGRRGRKSGNIPSIASLLDLALKLSNALHDLQLQVRNAPHHIQALENETEAIRLVLAHVEGTIQSAAAARHGSPGSAAMLGDLRIELGNSEAVLKKLSSFINNLKNKTSTLRRIKWAHKKEKARELMEELKKLRTRIGELQLAYSNLSLTRMGLVLQDIQIMQHREYVATRSLGVCLRDTKDQLAVDRNTTSQSQSDIVAALEAVQTATPALPPDWVESISKQLATTINNFRPRPAEAQLLAAAERQPVLSRTEPGVQYFPEAKNKNTAVSPHQTQRQESFKDASSPLRHPTLEFKLKLVQSQCSINCVCRCHGSVSSYRPWNKFPKGLQMITGSILFEYSSCPASRVTCDLRSCSKLRLTRLTLRYGFPFWSFKYAIHVLVEKSSTNSLTFALATRRITRRNARDNILWQTLVGNLSAIKRIVFENPTAVLDVDYDGNSALHISIGTIHPRELSLEIWKVLLQAGADPDQVNAEGLSFRHYIAHLVLQNNIPLNLQSEVENAIQISQCFEDLDLTFIHEIVVKRCPIDLVPVLEAGNAEIVAQVNKEDRFRMTPLMYALVLGDAKAANALIKAGASVHKKGPFGRPILDYVSGLPPNTCATLLDLLLTAGANAKAAFPTGWSLFHTAAIHDNVTMISRLLQEGARPDCVGPRGNRPIHYAASDNSVKAVYLLYEQGVDINVLADNGLSPLGVAIQHNAPDAQLALLELGANHLITGDWGTFFHIAAYWGCEKTFRTLSRFKLKGLNVDARDAEGLTATEVFENRYDKTDELTLAFYKLKDSIISQSPKDNHDEGEIEDKEEFFDAYEFLHDGRLN